MQTTCRNLYVMHDIIVLRNFLMAGFCKYHLKVKKWNFSDFDSQKAVTEHNNAYSFSPIANACYIFFAKIVFVMCRRHVVTYKSCTTSQHCTIFKWQGFVNTIKKWKNGISVIWTAKKPLLSIKMPIRFRPLRMCFIFFFAKFVFIMCRRHVVTYTSCTTSQCCIIFKWQGFVNTI